MSRSPSPPARLSLAGAALVLLGVLAVVAASERAAAYVLYDNGATDWVVGSEDALRWSPEVWAPGATLPWRVEDAPEWKDLFGSSEALVALVEEGLAEWSQIATADIQWEVAGFADGDVGRRDSTNQVFLQRSLSTVGRTRAFDEGMTTVHVWFARDTSGARPVWHVTECDVGLRQLQLEEFKREEWFSNHLRWSLSNSFQSCLGLGNAGPYPGSEFIRESALDSFDVIARWNHYYNSPWYPSHFLDWSNADRSTGASLLRPLEGWLPTVGSISGSLAVGDEPVAYAQVWALRHQTDPDTARPIGAYSNRSGAFLIEGLEPGDYLLWAHPAHYQRLGTGFPVAGATTDVRDAVLLGAVRVQAGRVTSGVLIPMEAGRY